MLRLPREKLDSATALRYFRQGPAVLPAGPAGRVSRIGGLFLGCLRRNPIQISMLSDLKLFHKDVHLPDEITKPLTGRYLRLAPTYTAVQGARQYRMRLPSDLTLAQNHLVEVGCRDGRVVHLTVRLPFRLEGDLFMGLAVDADMGRAAIKRAWVAAGGYSVVDAVRYVQPPVKPGRDECRFAYRDSGFQNTFKLVV